MPAVGAAAQAQAQQQAAAGGEDEEGEEPPPPPVTLSTFRELMDELAEQKAQMEAIATYSDVSIVRVACEHLKLSLLPSPTACLEALHELLPSLAADLFQGFMGEVQNALMRLQAHSNAVEEYVDKIQFLASVRENEKKLDMRCNEIHDLYALIDDYTIPVGAMDRAAYASLDSTYNT